MRTFSKVAKMTLFGQAAWVKNSRCLGTSFYQQTERLIHKFKKLTGINAIDKDLNFLDPTRDIFPTNMVRILLLGKLCMRKPKTKRAVPQDVVPERRTKRCSPRFRPGDRFWNQVSDTCRQALRERNVGP